ncbi:unnamed protein product [Angiostrongylus costaricensis]|uniref:Uncharacterized protein n=1 Tax=Angiostrongylus costaricensis TaxID=334426 RepID=A0A158PJS1_ANGCS|nr:unnamed protein product [Angiostrongylus costaricensis]
MVEYVKYSQNLDPDRLVQHLDVSVMKAKSSQVTGRRLSPKNTGADRQLEPASRILATEGKLQLRRKSITRKLCSFIEVDEFGDNDCTAHGFLLLSPGHIAGARKEFVLKTAEGFRKTHGEMEQMYAKAVRSTK